MHERQRCQAQEIKWLFPLNMTRTRGTGSTWWDDTTDYFGAPSVKEHLEKIQGFLPKRKEYLQRSSRRSVVKKKIPYSHCILWYISSSIQIPNVFWSKKGSSKCFLFVVAVVLVYGNSHTISIKLCVFFHFERLKTMF